MRGFTLIETLIYTALCALLVSGTFAAAAVLRASAERSSVKLQLMTDEMATLDRLSASLRNANAVLTPAPGDASDELRLSTDRGVISLQEPGMMFDRSNTGRDRVTITMQERSKGPLPILETLSRTIYLGTSP